MKKINPIIFKVSTLQTLLSQQSMTTPEDHIDALICSLHVAAMVLSELNKTNVTVEWDKIKKRISEVADQMDSLGKKNFENMFKNIDKKVVN